ncbi:MAG TPA: hypothetical protein VF773_11905 [Verrucomicrobiae bacterium]
MKSQKLTIEPATQRKAIAATAAARAAAARSDLVFGIWTFVVS